MAPAACCCAGPAQDQLEIDQGLHWLICNSYDVKCCYWHVSYLRRILLCMMCVAAKSVSTQQLMQDMLFDVMYFF